MAAGQAEHVAKDFGMQRQDRPVHLQMDSSRLLRVGDERSRPRPGGGQGENDIAVIKVQIRMEEGRGSLFKLCMCIRFHVLSSLEDLEISTRAKNVRSIDRTDWEAEEVLSVGRTWL